MAFTHVAAGLLFASAVAAVAPAYAVPAAAGAAAGGLLPDLDLLVGSHRRTLHFPVLYWLPAALFGAVALLAPSAPAVFLALTALTAGVHAVSDAAGAADELRPWERTSTNGVYLHVARRWVEPRYWVRYDGAPEDLLLAVVLAAPALVVYDPPVRTLVGAMLVLAAGYALVRKRIPEVGDRLT